MVKGYAVRPIVEGGRFKVEYFANAELQSLGEVTRQLRYFSGLLTKNNVGFNWSTFAPRLYINQCRLSLRESSA